MVRSRVGGGGFSSSALICRTTIIALLTLRMINQNDLMSTFFFFCNAVVTILGYKLRTTTEVGPCLITATGCSSAQRKESTTASISGSTK